MDELSGSLTEDSLIHDVAGEWKRVRTNDLNSLCFSLGTVRLSEG